MEILGVGPSELLFIVVIALIILGPKDMQKAGRSIGRWLKRITTSDGWKLFQQTSSEIQTLPNRLMREAALDELNEVQSALRAPIESGRSATGPADAGRPGAVVMAPMAGVLAEGGANEIPQLAPAPAALASTTSQEVENA